MKLKYLVLGVAFLGIGSVMLSKAYAGGQPLEQQLDAAGINHIVYPEKNAVYLMDDTDPRRVCLMADKDPKANIKEVFNVKTLKQADCRKP